ncbi:MAG: 30S ribosomal protein S11 [Candidatus Nomurabacteria bacterium]|nr:MAG: 30S ribosomal protein S11 [Candidatus Nomurabacteria bacterium]
MATPAATTTKKKKSKRTVSKGVLCVKATYNNTIVTVTDEAGNVLTSASAGSCGFRGARKNTAYAAQVAAEKALNGASQTFGLKSVVAKVSGVGQGRDSALRAAMGAGIDIVSISDVTALRFGGCRPRKAPVK